jgi:glutamyl-tRNA synthetase
MDDDAWQKVMVKGHDRAAVVLDAALDVLADVDWTPGAINDAVIGWIDAHEMSRSKDQAPIRVAVTGRTVGAPLWESLAVLGRDRTLERLRAARARL